MFTNLPLSHSDMAPHICIRSRSVDIAPFPGGRKYVLVRIQLGGVLSEHRPPDYPSRKDYVEYWEQLLPMVRAEWHPHPAVGGRLPRAALCHSQSALDIAFRPGKGDGEGARISMGYTQRRSGSLHCVGQLGTAFDAAILASLHHQFQTWMRSQSALIEPPRGKGVVIVGPTLVAQISLREWIADRKRREEVLLGLRDDKSAQDVLLPGPAA
jgi:hypothetical protein